MFLVAVIVRHLSIFIFLCFHIGLYRRISLALLQRTYKVIMPHSDKDIEMPDPITVSDVKDIAKKRLDPAVWDYYTTGADEEQSVNRNELIFKKYARHLSLLSHCPD